MKILWKSLMDPISMGHEQPRRMRNISKQQTADAAHAILENATYF